MHLAAAKEYAAKTMQRDPSGAGVSALSPFQIMVGPEHIVAHRAWQETRGRLRDAVLAGPGLTLLVGPPGTGKTLMLEDLAQSLRSSGAGVALQARGDIPAERLDPKMGDPLVVLVDEADRMDDAALHQLGVNGPYAVVLAGLSDRGVDDQSVEIVRLLPLDRADVATFIVARLASAGVPAETFGDAAIDRLTERAGGIPRLVNTIAGAALFLADRDGNASVDAWHVDEAAKLQGGELELSGVDSLRPRPATPVKPASQSVAVLPQSAPAKAEEPDEPVCDAGLTFVYPIAVVPKPAARSNAWDDLMSSIRRSSSRAEGPAIKRPPFFLGFLAGIAVTGACAFLAMGLWRATPQVVATATPIAAQPKSVEQNVLPATPPVAAAPEFDEPATSRVKPAEQPAPVKQAETVQPAPPAGGSVAGPEIVPPPAITVTAQPPAVAVPPAAADTPATPATTKVIPSATPIAEPTPAVVPTTAEPTAPVTSSSAAASTEAPPTPPVSAVPSAAEVSPAPVAAPKRFTLSMPTPVVIRYPGGMIDGPSRAARLAASLRAAGYASAITLPLLRNDAPPGARFYFAEDRAEAIAVLRVSGLPGTVTPVSFDGQEPVPRPGTVELVIGK